ncbi:MAG TPA: hypothetical protein ENN72_04290 [Firmicutes bacterium]|nr:hypothetical protein [Bacillota bacterium]
MGDLSFMKEERLLLIRLFLKWEKSRFLSRLIEGENLSPFILFHLRGVIENLLYIDYALKQYLKKKPGKETQWILRLAFHELLFGEKSPDYAVTHEAVRLASRLDPGKKGLVNAVVRNFIRDGKEVTLPVDEMQALSLRMSLPLWLTELLEKQYGRPSLEKALLSLRNRRDYDIHINVEKTDPLSYKALLDKSRISYDEWNVGKAAAFRVHSSIRADELPGYEEGLFFVQDLGAQIAASLALPVKGPFLDVGSAPGGKLMFLAPDFQGETVEALDISSRRLDRLTHNFERMGYPLPGLIVEDFLKYDPPGAFEKIFLDVPCSGLGVLSKKCDIAYRLTPENLMSLKEIQQSFLEKAFSLLKPGGELIYSTCTLNRDENEGQITEFLSRHNSEASLEDLQLRKQLNHLPFHGIVFRQGFYQALPPDFPGDGMFGAVVRRRG